MTQDLYLRFDSEAQFIDVLYAKKEEIITEGEETILVPDLTKPLYKNIDTIGIIYQPMPDPENPPEPIPYDGFFVNVRVVNENPEPLLPYSIDPEPYPMRVWG